MTVFIGAEEISTPIGLTTAANFNQMTTGITGVRKHTAIGFNKEDLFVAAFSDNTITFKSLITGVISRLNIAPDILSSNRTKVIISTTKGDLNNGLNGALLRAKQLVTTEFKLAHPPLLISNACASGLIAISKAAEYIQADLFDHVIVVGCDVLSDFVIFGFQSLFAMDSNLCKPYDANRAGINLGEGAAAVVLSNSNIFAEAPLVYLGGSSSNDANHISGPSRTGEGLYRTVKTTLQKSGLKASDIDHISGHGTATRFNDDMESVAFSRLSMNHIPMNSLKGYFGHTLGAAGVLETAVAIQSLRQQKLLASSGFEVPGTTESLNIIATSQSAKFQTILKTASGFGGGNASIIIQKP